MATRSRTGRVAKDHQFLIVDPARQQYVFHDGAAIAARPIHARTLSRVLAFYEDYLGWPVYHTDETEDPMKYPYYSNPEWTSALAAINHDPLVKVRANTLNALLKRGYIHVPPTGGLGLTPDGEQYLEQHANDPLPEMLRFPAFDDSAPRDFAGPALENGHSQTSAIRAGVDEAVREHVNGNGSRALPTFIERHTETRVRALRALQQDSRAYVSSGLKSTLSAMGLIARVGAGQYELTAAGLDLLRQHAHIRLAPYQQIPPGTLHRDRRRKFKAKAPERDTRIAVHTPPAPSEVVIPPPARPSAVLLLRTVIFDTLEAQLEQRAPDLLPSIRALRATE